MPSNPKNRGVLPINAAQTRKPFRQQPRSPAPKLRLIIRRLPPGLTEVEFWECIGAEWQLGQGKVDWAAFKAGKISRDLAKPSRPARAYLKVKDQSLLDSLSAHVKVVTFQDAKNTTRDPSLIGPPSLEFAPYSKIPSGRVRNDGRQGTIDQDPEFIDFLQSLTEPITKSAANGEQGDLKQDKLAITPLVQFIKDKKANKAKEKEAATSTKSTKKAQEGKDSKENRSSGRSEQTTVVKKGTTKDAEKVRMAKATQQTVESIKKSVAEIKGQGSTKQDQQVAAKTPATTSQPTPKKERQRGDVSAAARIIGRDLGLVPPEGRKSRNQRAVTSPASTTIATNVLEQTTPAGTSTKPSSSQSSTPTTASQKPPTQPPTGPRNLRNQTPQPSSSKQNSVPPSPSQPSVQPQAQSQPKSQPQKTIKQPPQPSPGAKSAFLKHANPSQGVTEELLRTTFSEYGTITRCEIDKKKGLGHIDFTEPEALRKALAASPVKVGNGSVVVLENRTPHKKVVQGQQKSNAAGNPTTSAASSPRLPKSELGAISEQAQVPAKTSTLAEAEPASIDTTTPIPASASISSTDAPQPASPSVDAPPPASPTVTQATPPSAPKGNATGNGGRGNQRGHYRGRGYRGRGGGFRGGNRAASNAAASTAGGAAPTAAGSGGGGEGKS